MRAPRAKSSASLSLDDGALTLLSGESGSSQNRSLQTVTCLHLFYNNHRWFPHEVHQYMFVVVSGHHCTSEVSENRLSEHGVSSLGQHDCDQCNIP